MTSAVLPNFPKLLTNPFPSSLSKYFVQSKAIMTNPVLKNPLSA